MLPLRELQQTIARSILADPRNPDTQTTLNVKVKFREGFRPFAPAVLREQTPRFFRQVLAIPVEEQHMR